MGERRCGKCGLPIHPQETAVRYYGYFSAHSEDRCISLLKMREKAKDAEIERLQEAIQPFSDCVFNDNGDMTVTPTSNHDSYVNAYFATKRAALQDKQEATNG